MKIYAKWSAYLALSSAFILAIASSIRLDDRVDQAEATPMMRLSLMSARAHAAPPAQRQNHEAPVAEQKQEQPQALESRQAASPKNYNDRPEHDDAMHARQAEPVKEEPAAEPRQDDNPAERPQALESRQAALPKNYDDRPEHDGAMHARQAEPVKEEPAAEPRRDNNPAERPQALEPRQAALPKNYDDRPEHDGAMHVRQASYLYQRPPTYPRRSLELGQQGVVVLHAEVMPDGSPRSVKVLQSSGHKLLDKAALKAVKKWEFEPTRIGAVATAGWVRVPVEFVIED